MQRESYSDVEVAAILNRHYLAVKVDRELRSEFDHRLIEIILKVRRSHPWLSTPKLDRLLGRKATIGNKMLHSAFF